MKKACVYTFTNAIDNYGQVLQYMAIQLFMEKIGYKAYVLRHDGTPQQTIQLPFYKRLFKGLNWRVKAICKKVFVSYQEKSEITNNLEDQKEILLRDFFKKAFAEVEKQEKLHPRKFEEFKKRYFNIEYYNNLIKEPPIADAYIVGSDQVWGWLSDENFLNFGSTNTKRIAFAPSFGGRPPKNEKQWLLLGNYLKRFDLVTVREPDGIEFCKKAGYAKAYHIPDPTLLIKSSSYDPFCENCKKREKKYILIYLLGNYTDINLPEIYQFANEKKLEVVYVESQGRVDDYEKEYPTIPEWLSLVKNAEYVFTNSFHGTAFSIIFHKKFLTFPLIGIFERMNHRIYSILEKYHLDSRIYDGDINIISNNIDYTEVENIREKDYFFFFNLMQTTLRN